MKVVTFLAAKRGYVLVALALAAAVIGGGFGGGSGFAHVVIKGW